MKFIFSLIGTVLRLAIFVVVPFVAIALITSRTDILFRVRSFVVQTGSMNPAIPPGSMVFTQPQDAYHKGDVVAFQEGAVVVTHRIAKVTLKNDSVVYQTKGDANNTPDSKLVAEKDVIGKELISVPYVGQAQHFLKSPPGFIAIIFVPTIAFISGELLTIKKEFENNIQKQVADRLKSL